MPWSLEHRIVDVHEAPSMCDIVDFEMIGSHSVGHLDNYFETVKLTPSSILYFPGLFKSLVKYFLNFGVIIVISRKSPSSTYGSHFLLSQFQNSNSVSKRNLDLTGQSTVPISCLPSRPVHPCFLLPLTSRTTPLSPITQEMLFSPSCLFPPFSNLL